MKGAVVGCLIAQEQRELTVLLFLGQIRITHRKVLEALSALAEPVVLGHFCDQEGFGGGCGLVLGAKAAEEGVEFVLVFFQARTTGTKRPVRLGGQDGEGAGEAVAEVVEAGCGFTGFGDRACGVLRVGLVGADLGFG